MNSHSNEREKIPSLFEQLISARRVRFPLSPAQVEAPKNHGVYIIYSPRGDVAYVGMTANGNDGLFRRMRDHIRAYSSFARNHLAPKDQLVAYGFTYAWLEVESPRARALLEAYTIGHLCPAYIGANILVENERKRELEEEARARMLEEVYRELDAAELEAEGKTSPNSV